MQTRRMSNTKHPFDVPFFLIFKILFALCILAGCYSLAINAKQSSYSAQQKRTDQLYSEFDRSHALIQSFQADRAHLTTLVFYASLLKNNSAGSIIVHLRRPGAEKDLAVGQFYLAQANQQEMLTFTFPPLENSKDSTYEFVVETSMAAGSVGIWASAENDYGEGTLISAGKQLPFDLSFFTYYRASLLEIFNASNLHFFFTMLVMLAFYLALGFFLLIIFNFTAHKDLLTLLVALLSMSIAFVPILFALMSLAFIKVNAPNLLLILICLLFLSTCIFFYRLKFLGHRLQLPSLNVSSDWFFWSVIAMLIYALFMRAAQADGIYVPNWIDGLVHQRSLDKILETGIQSNSQIYHAGFYAHVILTSILTGSSAPEAMLVSAQLFNALGGITFLFLASRFFSSRFALLLSLATYWFLAPFPSYLLTWSRFPFLLGLLLLPALIAYSKEILSAFNWRLIFSIALIFTGMLLIHYGVTIILLAFLLACLCVDSESRDGVMSLFKALKWRLLPLVLGLLLPAIIFLGPKLMRFFFDQSSRQTVVDLSKEAASQIDAFHILKLTAQNGGILMWAMAGVGLLLALGYARKSAFLLLTWYTILLAATWLQILVWGIAISSYANLLIAASIPLSILAGFSVEILFSQTPGLMRFFEKIHSKPSSLAALSLLIIILTGSYSQLGTVNPISVLFADRDRNAAQWIRENTPSDAVILVDSFQWGQTYWPSDGGGWLKSLTARKVIYARSADEISKIEDLIAVQKIQLIYLGQGYGELSERHFLENPAYQVLYQSQGGTIFAVKNNGLEK